MDASDIFSGFIAKINSEFLGTFLSYANEMWLGFYGLFVMPTVIFLAFTGVRYMMNDLSGDKLRATYIKFGKYLFLCIFGYALLPTIENMEQGFENLISNKAASAKISMVGQANKKAAIYNAEYDTKREEFTKLYNEKMNRGEVWWDNGDVEATLALQHMVMFNKEAISKMDAEDLKELQAQAGIVYDARQDAEAANEEVSKLNKMMSIEGNQAKDDDEAFVLLGFWEIVTLVLSFLAGLLELLVRVVRIFILIILRFSFPIALAVTIIPGLDKTAESWWESYKTVLLWGIVLILIKLIISFSGNITLGFDDGWIQFVAALFQFIGGIFYLLSPNITVMCFGGSSAISQLPQQMVQSMSAVGAAAGMMITKGKGLHKGMKAYGDFAAQHEGNMTSRMMAKATRKADWGRGMRNDENANQNGPTPA